MFVPCSDSVRETDAQATVLCADLASAFVAMCMSSQISKVPTKSPRNILSYKKLSRKRWARTWGIVYSLEDRARKLVATHEHDSKTFTVIDRGRHSRVGSKMGESSM